MASNARRAELSDSVPLYDFLYRDSGRMASYYAQIFSGRLSSLEQTDSERTSEDKGAKLNIHVASGDLKQTRETSRSAKRTIDPHDVITTEVLAFLQDNNHIEPSAVDAAHGRLVLTHGTLVFIDRSMAELAVLSFDLMISEEERKPKKSQNPAGLQGMRFIREFLPQLSIPSAFVMQSSDGSQVAGTIKEDGMEEPIASYYFKHGAAGLADVYLIGIKETPSDAFTLPGTQLIGAGQQAAQALTDMLFPPDAIRVTPLALFRKLF